eukprot:scaffold419720_cov25-Prasinocladus_malaysianus.AAC.1
MRRRHQFGTVPQLPDVQNVSPMDSTPPLESHNQGLIYTEHTIAEDILERNNDYHIIVVGNLNFDVCLTHNRGGDVGRFAWHGEGLSGDADEPGEQQRPAPSQGHHGLRRPAPTQALPRPIKEAKHHAAAALRAKGKK